MVQFPPKLVLASLNKMLHNNYLWMVESDLKQIQEVSSKTQPKTRKQRQLLSEAGFRLCTAPPSLSRDSRIKMKKTN